MHTNPTSSTEPAPEATEAQIVSELRAEMSRRLFNLSGAADVLKLNRSTVSRKLKGDVPLTTLELLRLCSWLDVSPGAIVDRATARAATERAA